MARYAQVENDTIVNVVEADADYAASAALVLVGDLTPEPGIGWMISGGTWTPPASEPDPLAPARSTIDDLLTQQEALQTQLQADIASVANWDTLTADERAAIMGRILNDGLGNAMQAILAHLQLTGNAPVD